MASIRGRTKHQIVSILVRLRFATGALDLRFAQHRPHRADQAFGDPVLQIKRVFERAIEPIGPNMLTAHRLDELATDADPVACLPQAALDQISDAELSRDLLRIDPFSLIAEGCIASHDREPAGARQFGDEILCNTVEKELRLGVATQILKREDGECRPLGRRRRRSAADGRRGGRPFIQDNAKDAHRARNILDLVLTGILEADREPVANLVAHCSADVYTARICQALHLRGDRDAIAVDQIAIRNHITHIDRNTETNPRVGRHLRCVFRHCALNCDRAADGIDNAVELHQKAIAPGPYNAAPMGGNLRIDEGPADRPDRRKGALLVDPHEPGVADDISAEDDSESVLYPGFAHFTAISRSAALPVWHLNSASGNLPARNLRRDRHFVRASRLTARFASKPALRDAVTARRLL